MRKMYGFKNSLNIFQSFEIRTALKNLPGHLRMSTPSKLRQIRETGQTVLRKVYIRGGLFRTEKYTRGHKENRKERVNSN